MDEEKERFLRKVSSALLPVAPILPETVDHLRPAAVLMPLFFDQGAWNLLFIRRSDAGEFHRGEVAFPGGAQESQDRSMEETALRETYEELGILAKQVSILGALPPSGTVSRYIVTPIVGVIQWPLSIVSSPAEVARVFSIPLTWLMEDSHWQNKEFAVPNRDKKVTAVVYEPYDNEVLWGYSAMITRRLIEKIKKEEQ